MIPAFEEMTRRPRRRKSSVGLSTVAGLDLWHWIPLNQPLSESSADVWYAVESNCLCLQPRGRQLQVRHVLYRQRFEVTTSQCSVRIRRICSDKASRLPETL